MSEIAVVALLSLLAGAAMPLGALVGKWDLIHPRWLGSEWRHFIVAFGGGALISAVALVLVPEGASKLTTLPAAISFAAGGFCFLWLSIYLGKKKSTAGQVVAMLSDFIPEAIALGAAFAAGGNIGLLLTALIILQNLPEGFNAFEELSASSKISADKIILGFCLMALLGPVAGLSGYFWLADRPVMLGILMLFASGGILYLIFDDIAPQAKLKKRWMPAFGAVMGFLLGLVGSMLAGH